MSNVRQDYFTVYTSGIIPAAETATDPVDVRGHDGVNLIVGQRGGGYSALVLQPEFSFSEILFDTDRQEILPTNANQEWNRGTIGVFDSTRSVTQVKDDITHWAIPSGQIQRRHISFDSPGATAMRFIINGSGLVGPDPGAVEIKASRTKTHYTGRRLS